jgi:protein-disulfide isomerase
MQQQHSPRRRMAVGTIIAAIVVLAAAVGLASSAAVAGNIARDIRGAAAVDALVDKVPQQGLILGKQSAPVEVIEYGDLQCPICKDYSERILPRLIKTQVDAGKIRLTFRNFVIIGPQSMPAATAAIAAGEQGRGWNFIQTFFRNQGEEGSGYVTDDFLEAIAKAAGVEDIPRWNEERKSRRIERQAKASTAEAGKKLGFVGTPSFAIRGPRSGGLKLLGTPQTAKAFAEAIAAAGR